MYKLNAECHLHILSYLTLTDQLALKHAAPWLFASHVLYYWRFCREFKLSPQLAEFEDAFELCEFLDIVSPLVRRLELQDISTEQLRAVWRGYRFPQLQQLICCVSDDIPKAIRTDEHVLLLTQIFPNILQLTLTSYASGEYLCNFRALTELRLLDCFGLQAECFIYIFNLLPLRTFSLLSARCYRNLDWRLQAIVDCKTLECVEINAELAIDRFYLIASLTDLPRLQRLTLHTADFYDNLLDRIVYLRALDIVGLSYNGFLYAQDDQRSFQHNLHKMKTLRRLILHIVACRDWTIWLIAKHCTNIEVLHLTRNQCIIGRDELLCIFERLTKLQILDLTGTRICQHFGQETIEDLTEALSARTTPLRLYCSEHCDSRLSDMRHEMLQVVFAPHEIELPAFGAMTIELLPKCV